MSDSIETQKIEFIMHHYFFPALVENKTRQKDNNAISIFLVLRAATKDSLKLEFFVAIGSFCRSVQCKNCYKMGGGGGGETKQMSSAHVRPHNLKSML